MQQILVVEPDGESTYAHCEDCEHTTTKIWGWISDESSTRAAYLARWTDGHVEWGAQIILSIGVWGEAATPSQRRRVAVECRMGSDRPSFMVVDAAEFDWARDEILGESITRAEVLDGPIAKETFALLDALTAQDTRFSSFLLSHPDCLNARRAGRRMGTSGSVTSRSFGPPGTLRPQPP